MWDEERGWEIGLQQLWEYLAQYCYLPRLFDHEVLLKAVRDGVSRLDAPFGCATGVNEAGYHTGLVFRSTGSVYFDEQSILVHPDHVIELPLPVKPSPPDTGAGTGEDTGPVMPPPPEKVTARYYGRAVLDPQRVNKDMGLIVEEVIERLTSLVGCNVEVTVEISAHFPSGFDEGVVRTISENSRVLKFENFGFEDE